jgi:hypothetical protein
MEDDNDKKEMVREIKNACRSLGEINAWLPRAIDNTLRGHRGTLDRVNNKRKKRRR